MKVVFVTFNWKICFDEYKYHDSLQACLIGGICHYLFLTDSGIKGLALVTRHILQPDPIAISSNAASIPNVFTVI